MQPILFNQRAKCYCICELYFYLYIFSIYSFYFNFIFIPYSSNILPCSIQTMFNSKLKDYVLYY